MTNLSLVAGLLILAFLVLLGMLQGIVALHRSSWSRRRLRPDNARIQAEPFRYGIRFYDRWVDNVRRAQALLPGIERPVGTWVAAALVSGSALFCLSDTAAARVYGFGVGMLGLQYVQLALDRAWHKHSGVHRLIVPVLTLLSGVGVVLVHLAWLLYIKASQL